MNNPIQEHYDKVMENVKAACKRSKRNPDEITLVVVTKGQPAEKILEVVNCGATVLGENYPEETLQKISEIKDRVKPEWHMIGHLQSRKIKLMSPTFSMIHSVDSLELAQKLDRYYAERNEKGNILLEVNVAGEESKFGFNASTKPLREALVIDFAQLREMKNIKICGLMTMPPYAEIGQDNKKVFDVCREFCDLMARKLALADCNQLSMGTSSDYEAAIECGATYVRIGEAIMGKRTYKSN